MTDGWREPCTYCGAELDPMSRETWHLVIGWERPGRAGGSDIALRQPRRPPKFACDVCVRRLQRGVSPRQETLA